MIEIGDFDDYQQTEPHNENTSLYEKSNNVLLEGLNWRREEIDTELGYFYDVAWEKDPFTGKEHTHMKMVLCFVLAQKCTQSGKIL